MKQQMRFNYSKHEDIEHQDGTASLVVDDLSKSENVQFMMAWEWFLEKSPDERATVIIRAFLDRDAWESDLTTDSILESAELNNPEWDGNRNSDLISETK